MNIKTTLILVVVIGLLIAGVFLLPEQENPNDPTPKARLFEDHATADTVRIDLVRPHLDPATLVRRDDVWRVRVGEVEVRADVERVRDILDPFENMLPRVTVGDASAAKRKEYGLDAEHRTVVRLHTMSAATYELHLGTTAPQGQDTIYASAGADGPVVVVSDAVRQAAWRTDEELRDRTPVDVHPLQVGTLAVRRVDGTGFRATFDADEQIWTFTGLAGAAERGLGRGDSESVELLRGFASEIAVAAENGFVSDAPTEEDLAKYGLTRPAFTITLTPRNGLPARTLRIGAREGEGDTATFLWAVEGEPSVYRSPARPESGRGQGPVEEGLLDLLDSPLDRFRDGDLLRLDAYANAVEVLLEAGDRRVHLKRMPNADGEEHWRIVVPDVKGWAQDEDVDAFVSDLKKLRIAAYADDTSARDAGLDGDTDPAARLTVTMVGDDEPRVFALGAEVPDVGRYLRRGGSDLLVVARPTLLEMIRRPWFRFRHREVRKIARDTVTRIEVTRGGTTEALVAEGNDWKFADGSSEKPDNEVVIDVLVTFQPVQTVRHPDDGFVARVGPGDDATLEAYGLKTPAVVLRLTYREGSEEKRIALHIGASRDGRHHARTEGAGEIRDSLIFVLSDEAWERVNRPLIADE